MGGGRLNRFYGIPVSPLGSAVLHYKCNIKHITHTNKECEVCIYYNPPPIKFDTLINKMNHSRSTALQRSEINYWGFQLVLRDPNLASAKTLITRPSDSLVTIYWERAVSLPFLLFWVIFEPHHRKTCLRGVCDQVRLKQACSATETS